MNDHSSLTTAVNILKRYGAKKVVLFGSAARGSDNDYSDIDLACEGVSPGQFYKALGKLLATSERSFDLVDMQDTKRTLRRRIEREGVLLYEAK